MSATANAIGVVFLPQPAIAPRSNAPGWQCRMIAQLLRWFVLGAAVVSAPTYLPNALRATGLDRSHGKWVAQVPTAAMTYLVAIGVIAWLSYGLYQALISLSFAMVVGVVVYYNIFWSESPDTPEEWQLFIAYARRVTQERASHGRVPPDIFRGVDLREEGNGGEEGED